MVRIEADNGAVGWGEALAPVAPEVLATIIRTMIAPVLRGADALAPRPTWERCSSLMRERGHLVGHQADALAAVDIALWDLAARLLGVPLARMLGGAFRTTVPTYVSGLPRPTDAERGELAAERAAAGTTAVKLHLGFGVDADLATVDAVRSAAPDLRVAVDAHWSYRTHDALRLARGLADRDGWFLEAPLAPEDEEGHAELVRRSPIPIAVGETLRNRYEFERWTSLRALDIAQPDVGRTGLTEALAIAEVCAARHVPVAPHHSVGLGVLLAAGIHLSAAIPNLLVFEQQPTTIDVAQRLLTSPLQPLPASFALPDGPGLGIDVDEAAIRHLAKEHA